MLCRTLFKAPKRSLMVLCLILSVLIMMIAMIDHNHVYGSSKKKSKEKNKERHGEIMSYVTEEVMPQQQPFVLNDEKEYRKEQGKEQKRSKEQRNESKEQRRKQIPIENSPSDTAPSPSYTSKQEKESKRKGDKQKKKEREREMKLTEEFALNPPTQKEEPSIQNDQAVVQPTKTIEIPLSPSPLTLTPKPTSEVRQEQPTVQKSLESLKPSPTREERPLENPKSNRLDATESVLKIPNSSEMKSTSSSPSTPITTIQHQEHLQSNENLRFTEPSLHEKKTSKTERLEKEGEKREKKGKKSKKMETTPTETPEESIHKIPNSSPEMKSEISSPTPIATQQQESKEQLSQSNDKLRFTEPPTNDLHTSTEHEESRSKDKESKKRGKKEGETSKKEEIRETVKSKLLEMVKEKREKRSKNEEYQTQHEIPQEQHAILSSAEVKESHEMGNIQKEKPPVITSNNSLSNSSESQHMPSKNSTSSETSQPVQPINSENPNNVTITTQLPTVIEAPKEEKLTQISNKTDSANSQQSQRMFSCFGKLSDAFDVCSGNGICIETDRCQCFASFEGNECQTPIQKQNLKNLLQEREKVVQQQMQIAQKTKTNEDNGKHMSAQLKQFVEGIAENSASLHEKLMSEVYNELHALGMTHVERNHTDIVRAVGKQHKYLSQIIRIQKEFVNKITEAAISLRKLKDREQKKRISYSRMTALQQSSTKVMLDVLPQDVLPAGKVS